MISSNMNTTTISLLNTAANTFFSLAGYLWAPARIGCAIWSVGYSEMYLLLFLPVSNSQKGFPYSVHLLPYQNLFKCKIYFSYIKKIDVTFPVVTEIQNQSRLGNQCEGAKTFGRSKRRNTMGLVSKPNIPSKEYASLQLQQRINNTDGSVWMTDFMKAKSFLF